MLKSQPAALQGMGDMGGMGGTVAMVEVTSLSFSVDRFIWVLSNDEALQKYPKSM